MFRSVLALMSVCWLGCCWVAPVLAVETEEDYTVISIANQAIKAQQEKDLPTALELYTQVVNSRALDGGDHLLTYIFNNRGYIYLTRNDPASAIRDFTHSIDNAPDYVAFINRGNAYTMLGDDHKAIADYTEALRLRPTSARAYANRSFSWLNLGQNAKAQQDMAQAKRLDPKIDNLSIN
ncbi:tetratricopeptide repeat protein [Megalodesulfovibrio gigas]|uniref:Putative TPR repeat-containing protein n=1 Tax=Megalodesulfovibrio gigas (strain ATCC 19364 / DSM 1382 / NCIMB 9332 / VKM B-1759) TaxID=1121448 RepID=T2GFW4_MEGG1|nr:tetratricopeptide repeat protein [Megalodesulfovibrio gigas]AGW15208.1 putative TPR repeat-containing protein [Megalodesulfovibrio gigas DSM 1382 = ATCC 19364]